MRPHRKFAVLAVAVALLGAVAAAPAQVSINIGVPPVCPYGYFPYAPYDCAPYGYYGPDWFDGGVFIGAGPWYHGHRGFYGHVDERFDPRHGYHGPLPVRGEEPFHGFHGDRAYDGLGHEGHPGHGPEGEHTPGYSGHGYPGGGMRDEGHRGGDHH
jgi:hypothetical protein